MNSIISDRFSILRHSRGGNGLLSRTAITPLRSFVSVLKEMMKSVVLIRSQEQQKPDDPIDDLDGEVEKEPVASAEKSLEFVDQVDGVRDDELRALYPGLASSKSIGLSSGEEEPEVEKFNLIKLSALIESSSKTGDTVLDLQCKLMNRLEWLPSSLGKLSTLCILDISNNQIMALPVSMGNLKNLVKLDAHSNQLINLPISFGELDSLTDLDLSANLLKSLPDSFGNLKKLLDLNLSSNRFSTLADNIGNLTCLQKLSVEYNDLEELPQTIGLCVSLLELRLDFNHLKALPESLGNLERLEILQLRYNRVKKLPLAIGNLYHLWELNVSFNELGSIPERLCLAVNLKYLHLGQNFADLKMLPESLGNLKILEYLDISDNQIFTLPDSFLFLTRLRTFHANQTPLELPPWPVTELGAQAVVQYMANFLTERDRKLHQRKKKTGFCSYICLLLCFGLGDE